MSRKSGAGARAAAHEADDLEGDMSGAFPVAALGKPQSKPAVRKVTTADKGKQVAKPAPAAKTGPGRKAKEPAKSKKKADMEDEVDYDDDPLNGGTNISPVVSREVNGKGTPAIKEESQAPYVPGTQTRTRYTVITEDDHGNLVGAGAQIEADGDFQFTPSNPRPRRGAAQGAKATAASRKRQLEAEQGQDHASKRQRTEEVQPLTITDSLLPLKFEELSKKYELLQQRFTELREIGIVEADRNYDNLRRMAVEKQQESDLTIDGLRAELASLRTLNDSIKQANEGNVGMLELARTEAEAQTRNLVKALEEMQAENRTLHTKLAAARASSLALEAPPGRSITSSAAKNKSQVKTLVVGSGDAAQAQVAQLKEDLYSDLTGLIVRAVDRQDDGDVYDCIQTGRNGTLHFKLGISLDHDNTTSWDDNVFIYEPQLDMSRDRSLLDVLPDYLTEEISFPRAQAARFYARVVDAITRQPQVREEDDDDE